MKKKVKPAGRPKGPKTRKRSYRLLVVVDDRLTATSKAVGCSTNDVVNTALNAYLP